MGENIVRKDLSPGGRGIFGKETGQLSTLSEKNSSPDGKGEMQGGEALLSGSSGRIRRDVVKFGRRLQTRLGGKRERVMEGGRHLLRSGDRPASWGGAWSWSKSGGHYLREQDGY